MQVGAERLRSMAFCMEAIIMHNAGVVVLLKITGDMVSVARFQV